MRSKCISQDQPPTLRRKMAPAPRMAWYYSYLGAHSWPTEIPLVLDLGLTRRSWLEGEPKPVPGSTRRRPAPSSQS